MKGVKTDIHDIQDDITSWLDGVLPERTPESTWIKLEEELAEWRSCPTDSAELIDTLVCIYDLADLYGINLSKAMHRKMIVNKSRKWKVCDKTGIMNHDETK